MTAYTGNLPKEAWRRSRYCDTGTCLEARPLDGDVEVRDSKNPDGPTLVFTPAEWKAFIRGAKDGDFDDLLPGASS
jgi:hypothetical protein